MDTEVWLQCQICFRCYSDRWYFRDHAKIYHRKEKKTENANNGEGEIISPAEETLPDLPQQNLSNNTGPSKPVTVIYQSNLKKFKANTTQVTQGHIDHKRGRGRPKGSTTPAKRELSGVKPKLKTIRRIDRGTKKINYYIRNKFRSITLKRLASKVIIDNNMGDQLSPENQKMIEFPKLRGRPRTPKKGQVPTKFLQSIQQLKKRKIEPPKRFGKNMFDETQETQETDQAKAKDDLKNGPNDPVDSPSPSPKKGRGRPRKLPIDFQPTTSTTTSSPKKNPPAASPAKSPIKMKIVRNIRDTPAVRNLGLRLGHATRPHLFSYQSTIKGHSPRNVGKSPLRPPSKNAKNRVSVSKQSPKIVSGNIANVSTSSSDSQSQVISKKGVNFTRRKDGKFTKKQSVTDTDTSTSANDNDNKVAKKRGRPRKITPEILNNFEPIDATLTHPTDREIHEIQNKTDDGMEIEKIMEKHSELTFEKVQVNKKSSTGTTKASTSTSTSTNIVYKSPAKDAFPAPDVQISVVELKK